MVCGIDYLKILKLFFYIAIDTILFLLININRAIYFWRKNISYLYNSTFCVLYSSFMIHSCCVSVLHVDDFIPILFIRYLYSLFICYRVCSLMNPLKLRKLI